MDNKRLLIIATITSVIAVSVLANLPSPDGLPNRTAIIDTIEEGEHVLYAYRTNRQVEAIPNEIVGQRTPNSRTVLLPDGRHRVAIDQSAPRYYEDVTGKWWYAEYGKTTKAKWIQHLSRTTPWEKVIAWVATPVYATTEFLTSGTSWSTPGDWNNSDNSIECIGAGGNGAAGATTNSSGGGGGGAYAKITNVTLSGSISYVVGTGGSVNDTYFNGAASSTASISCAAGKNALGTTAGNGGTAGNSTGTTKYAGGNGAAGAALKAAGGGGGSAGNVGAGKGGAAAGAGVAGGGGGGGSNGGSSTAGVASVGNSGGNGGAGTGGTGGGAGDTDAGGSGGTGTVGGGGGGGWSDNSTASSEGGAGGCDTTFDGTHGACGGGGGGGGDSGVADGGDGGAGGTYGAGGGGGGRGTSTPGAAGGGGQGIIVITYTPSAGGTTPDQVIIFD